MTNLEHKVLLYEEGVRDCVRFLKHNRIVEPAFRPGKHRALNKWQAVGLYVNMSVLVDVEKTRWPAYKKGRTWSFPRYKVDKTAMGVVAHETGHHVQALRVCGLHEWQRKVLDTEPAVTGYEPTPGEAFAEAMRLFILNPDLLKVGRPKRFEYLRYVCQLKPLDLGRWNQVLEHAPDHIKQAATRWAGR